MGMKKHFEIGAIESQVKHTGDQYMILRCAGIFSCYGDMLHFFIIHDDDA